MKGCRSRMRGQRVFYASICFGRPQGGKQDYLDKTRAGTRMVVTSGLPDRQPLRYPRFDKSGLATVCPNATYYQRIAVKGDRPVLGDTGS